MLAGLLCALAVLIAGGPARGAAVVEGPRSDVSTVTCSIEEGGTTTCAVSQGAAAVCSLRKGQDIERSYLEYDYLNVPPGCALDIDYWRAHAPGGTANYDETWTEIGSDGAATQFFGSDQSFLDMLAPQAEGEGPYRALARAFTAAELNRLNGAALPEQTEAALNEASVLLLASPGEEFDQETGTRATGLAAVLSAFVAGASGPGLCQVMTEPIGPEDVGKTLIGVDSGDQGTILSLDENREKSGAGVVTIGPLTADDQFLYADEAFTIDGIRKARFTQDSNDCVTVDAGEETTVAVGGIPSDPVAISARMQQLARSLLVLIALNTETEAPPAPAAGPGGPTADEGSSGGGGGSSSGLGGGGFPSAILPAVGGSGSSQCVVPDLVGLTEAQARGRLTLNNLIVGTVTVVSSLSPPSGLVSTAYAQSQANQQVVISQQPAAGTPCTGGDSVNLQLSADAQPLPEPSTLPMIVVAFAALGFLIWRGRRRGASGAAIVLLALGIGGCDSRAVEERIALAKQYIDSGRPNGAVIELKKAIQEQPGNAEARALLGQAYIGLGRLHDAEKELTRALAIEPGAAALALELGRVWLRQGSEERLLSELQPQPDWPGPDQATAWSLRGEAELAAGRPQEARQSFERAAALEPVNVDPLIGLVRAAMLAEQDEAAGAALDRALALAPSHPVLLGLKGERAFEAGDYRAAEAAFRSQLEASPENLIARIDLAQALMAQSRDGDAEAELSSAFAAAPEHPEAHYLAAVIKLQRADYAAAADHAAHALKSRPRHIPSRALAASAAAELGRWEDTRAHLEVIRSSDPVHPLVAELSPRVLDAMKPAAGGKRANLRPLEQDLALFRLEPPADPKLREALRAIAPGNPESRSVFARELVLASEPWAARGLALAEHRAGRPVEARFALQSALARSPDDADSRAVLADLYLLEGDGEAALPHLRRLARERPRDPGVLNNLAWIMYLRGELGEAGMLSERALALAPRDPRILDTRGVILLRSGDTDRALAMLGRAAGFEAAPPEARIHLAQALMQRGDTAEAKAVLTRTLATPQDASAHRAASVLLRELEP